MTACYLRDHQASGSGQSAEGYGKDKPTHVISFLSHSSRLHFNERGEGGRRRSGGKWRKRGKVAGGRGGMRRGGWEKGVEGAMGGRECYKAEVTVVMGFERNTAEGSHT